MPNQRIKSMVAKISKEIDSLNEKISTTKDKEIQESLHQVLVVLDNTVKELRSLAEDIPETKSPETKPEAKKEVKYNPTERTSK